MAKPSARSILAANVRDFKILLYLTDDGSPCAESMTAAVFVLRVVYLAMKIEMIRSKDIHDIKAALDKSVDIAAADKFQKDFLPELVRCLDLALKYAAVIKPANFNKAVRTHEANPSISARTV